MRKYLQDRETRIADFENLTVPSKPYQDALNRLDRLTVEFVDTHRALAFYTTRQPALYDNSLMYGFSDDFLESAIDVASGVMIGTHHAARRELRYLLENAVKVVYVDQQRPAGSIEERIRFLSEGVPRGKIDVVDDVDLQALDAATQADFRARARSLFGELSGFVHPSKEQLSLRLKRSREGRGAGFDTARELERASKTMFQVYDIVIVLLCHGIGLSMTGDLFIQVWDEHPGWPFHKGRFTQELSRYFDYKAERKHRAT